MGLRGLLLLVWTISACGEGRRGTQGADMSVCFVSPSQTCCNPGSCEVDGPCDERCSIWPRGGIDGVPCYPTGCTWLGASPGDKLSCSCGGVLEGGPCPTTVPVNGSSCTLLGTAFAQCDYEVHQVLCVCRDSAAGTFWDCSSYAEDMGTSD